MSLGPVGLLHIREIIPYHTGNVLMHLHYSHHTFHTCSLWTPKITWICSGSKQVSPTQAEEPQEPHGASQQSKELSCGGNSGERGRCLALGEAPRGTCPQSWTEWPHVLTAGQSDHTSSQLDGVASCPHSWTEWPQASQVDRVTTCPHSWTEWPHILTAGQSDYTSSQLDRVTIHPHSWTEWPRASQLDRVASRPHRWMEWPHVLTAGQSSLTSSQLDRVTIHPHSWTEWPHVLTAVQSYHMSSQLGGVASCPHSWIEWPGCSAGRTRGQRQGRKGEGPMLWCCWWSNCRAPGTMTWGADAPQPWRNHCSQRIWGATLEEDVHALIAASCSSSREGFSSQSVSQSRPEKAPQATSH